MDAATVRAAHADAAPIVEQQRVGAGVFEHVDSRFRGNERRELTNDAPAGGAAPRVDDSADRVTAFQPKRQLSAAIRIEPHAEALEVTHTARSLVAECHGSGFPHEAAAGNFGVATMNF